MNTADDLSWMRVLFTTIPGISSLHSLAPLASAMASAGADVAVASSASFAPWVSRAGFRALPAGLDWVESYGPPRPLPAEDMDAGARRKFFIETVLRELPAPFARDLLDGFESWRPDLVIHGQSECGGPLAARAAGVPSVTLSGISFDTWRDLLEPNLHLVAEAAGDLGMTLPDGSGWLFELAFLSREPAGWCTRADLLPEGTIPLRPVPFDATDGETSIMTDLVGSVVYLTLGTVLNRMGRYRFKALIEAVAGEPYTAVLTIGASGDPDSLGPLPPNVRVATYIPNTALLPRCAAVVSHAGWNTVLGAIMAGAPQVCLPMGADQPHNAARCEQLGIGVSLTEVDLAPDAIRQAIRTILSDESYRTRTMAIRDDTVANCLAPEDAARRLAALLPASRPGKVS